MWVWISASKKISLSVLARNPHKGLAREISHETGRGRVKESPRAEQRKRAEQRSQQNRAVDRREQELEFLEDELAFVVTLWKFRSNTR